MKIACVTDSGTTISEHFGRAAYYAVVTIENGQVVGRELRPKVGHNQFSHQEHHPDVPGFAHGTDPASHNRHAEMASPISDCEAVLARGMGMGAYQSLQRLGIKVVVTDVADIEEAAKAYAQGTLENHLDRLH